MFVFTFLFSFNWWPVCSSVNGAKCLCAHCTFGESKHSHTHTHTNLLMFSVFVHFAAARQTPNKLTCISYDGHFFCQAQLRTAAYCMYLCLRLQINYSETFFFYFLLYSFACLQILQTRALTYNLFTHLVGRFACSANKNEHIESALV